MYREEKNIPRFHCLTAAKPLPPQATGRRNSVLSPPLPSTAQRSNYLDGKKKVGKRGILLAGARNVIDVLLSPPPALPRCVSEVNTTLSFSDVPCHID